MFVPVSLESIIGVEEREVAIRDVEVCAAGGTGPGA